MTDTDIVPAGSSAVETTEAQVPVTPGHGTHPGPRQYVLIAVVLCVLTAIEVGMYYLEGDVDDNLLIALLAVLATVKFFLVAGWYMHMKVDLPFFRRLFVIGMIGAVIVYGVTLLTFASTLL
jgi:cytochrome c oxidase subunit 4